MIKRLLLSAAVLLAANILSPPPAASAQTTDGSITIQTMDATKALLPGTHLVLTDTDTNIAREGTTLSSGTFKFEALPPSTYRLTVEHAGFNTVQYDEVIVQAGVSTPLNIVLKVGATSQEVNVSSVSAPVIETSSNQLSSSIDINQVNNLPVLGRSLLSLQALTPGYTSATGTGVGTFNGTANASYGASIDGINSTSLRMDSGNGPGASITFRPENIQEFTVQAGELDPSQGGGRSAAQSLFVTNRGTNKYHGRVFEDFQNAAINANTWASGITHVRKGHLILNDFGGSVGGPILKDKLFFFASYAQNISPSTQSFAPVVPTAAAQLGNYTYATAGGGTNTINVLQFAKNAGFDPNVNAATTLNYELIKTSYQYGNFTQGNTQYNTQTLNFLTPLTVTNYFPAGRLDYTMNKKLSFNLSGNMTKGSRKGQYPGNFPGPYFQQKFTGSSGDSYVLSFGVNYTITPSVLNQFNVGFLYTNGYFSPEAANYCTACQGALAQGFGLTNPIITYGLGGNYYPYLTIGDDVSWQKGRHTIKFGGEAWHQQDHYYNAPLGYYNITLGMSSIDPAYNPITGQIPSGTNNPLTPANPSGAQSDVAGLYAYLNGRISNVGNQLPVNFKTGGYGPPGGYNLDELAVGGGVYVMDSWRVQPGFTLNYGLRWDFIGDQHDLKSAYTGPSSVDLFGSSGFLNIFQPGANAGPANPLFTTAAHKYSSNLVLPQPQFGFAWNPSSVDGWAGRLLGQGKSVIRASYTIKNYTEGGQNFWNNASNGGYNFFNTGSVAASNSTGPQFFAPGTVHIVAPSGYVPGVTDPQKACPSAIESCVNVSTEAAGVIPPLNQTPSTFYQTTITQSSLFFKGAGGVAAINPHIKQPYTESYTLGYQRQIGKYSAIEVRYVGDRTLHDWLNLNYNEVNGLNNGFLQDFQAAQQNLAINNLSLPANKQNTDFSNHGTGPAMPILSAAFAGSSAGNFQNASYITFLKNGSLGGLAAAVANNQTFYCNVVSKSFAPCAAAVPSAPASSAFAPNLFQANAFMEGKNASYLDSVGSSNYNSVQVEFRQQTSHGVAFNANYTYGKILGISQQGGISSFPVTFFTLHNMRLNYVPSAYDIRNTFHMRGTYDLPFGRNKMFLNSSRAMNYVVGGWTLGGIFIYQSGAPSLLSGGLSSTINSASDGGVRFVGGSAKTIQSQVHIRPSAAGNTYVNFLPASLQSPVSANPNVVVPNTTPGTIGNLNYIYGPKWNTLNMAVTKDMPVFDRVHMNIQCEVFNLPNHPAWLLGNTTVQSATFGTTSSLATSARKVELRANITF